MPRPRFARKGFGVSFVILNSFFQKAKTDDTLSPFQSLGKGCCLFVEVAQRKRRNPEKVVLCGFESHSRHAEGGSDG